MSSHVTAPTTRSSGLPSRGTVLGLWSQPSPSAAIEVAGRVETPVSLPKPPRATYAAYHEPHSTPNTLDDFFGAAALEAHLPRSHRTFSAPPPYVPDGHKATEKQAEIHSVPEPPTLARMLFKYGFFFFPFWLAGIYILFSPLLPTPDWEAGKTEAEKAQQLQFLREIEKKWARRCLYAMLSLVLVALLLVIIIKFGIMANI